MTNEPIKAGEPIAIRDARTSDLDAVFELLRECALPETGVAEGFGSFLVATRNGRVVGGCGLERHGSDALLRSVVVAAEVRRSGIGRKLTTAALTRAREQRVENVYLLTTTASDFFSRLGFELARREDTPAGIRSSWEFANGCPSTATLMARAP